MLLIKSTFYFTALTILTCSQVFTVSANTLVDPTRPAVAFDSSGQSSKAEAGDQSLVLNAITWQGKQAYAVINNKIYHRGDSVLGVKISEIAKEHVLFDDGRQLTLFTSVTGE